MSKKAKKRPTEASWDSDDDLLKEDVPGVSAFSKVKGDDEDIDEEALLQIEGDEEIGEGDTFQILDPEASGFDESIDLGLETSQNEQEALDYEDTVQEESMEGMTDTDQSFSELKTEIKTEPLPVETLTLTHHGLFKEPKKEDSDSDEDKGDHRERFKSERKMISLVSTKYSKPIPETLEVTAEMQDEINKFEKNKAPVKQRLGQKTGPQKRPQNQRQNQGQFGPRFPGNQNIRGPGPRRGKNQWQQNFTQRPRMNRQEQFRPRHINPQQTGPRPLFPHEMNLQQGQAGNQFRPPGPGAPLNQESLLGPRPLMMQVPRPLMDSAPGQNIHVNPQFFGPLPGPEGYPGQPQPFSQGQPFQPPPQSQPSHFPREAWPPQHPSPTPERYPPPQHNQPPFSGPQPLYPPASAAFTQHPGPPQPLTATSGAPTGPPHFQHPHPHMGPQQPPIRPPYPVPQGGLPGQPQHFQGPNAQPPRFMPQQRPDLNQTPPDLHIQFNPIGQQGQRPQNPQNQGGQFRPQAQNQFRPQAGQQIRPQGIRPQGRQVMPPSNQIRAQVGFNRARGVLGNAGTRLTGVGRGITKQAQQQKTNKLVMDARQRLAMRQVELPQNQGFNPKPRNPVNKNNNNNMPQGNKITVVNSRGVKRQSLESPNVVPVKQTKKEEPVSMEPVDPELQRALDEQRRQREAIRAKKEQNRLASAGQRRKELEEKRAIEEQQGQKIRVLGTQYPGASPSVSQNTGQFTNIVQVQTTPPGMGQPTPAGAAISGQTKAQRFNVGHAVRSPANRTPRLRGRGRGRGRSRKQNGASMANTGFDPEHQVHMISQQEEQFQQHTPKQVTEAKQLIQDSFHNKPTVGQGHNRPSIGQGQGQKVQIKPVKLLRSDSKGKVIGTYSAMPTKNDEGQIVYKLKIESAQKRIVQASPSPASNRTVVAGSGEGQVERQVVPRSGINDLEPSRTVVATGRTIGIGRNPHLRSRKVSVEGLTSTTQEAKLLDMVKNVGVVCEDIKFIPAQRRAILAFLNIEMATVFVKKYNRTMVDLTHIHVKEVPE